MNRSLRLMIWDGMLGTTMFALASGGFIAAFALALGANNFQIGILIALPYITQVAQLPAILAVERLRKRKFIGIPASFLTNLFWIPAGAVPFLMETPGSGAIFAMMAIIGFRGIFASTWTTCWVSWMSDLVPRSLVGSYYGRRWVLVMSAVAVVSLAASFFVNWWSSNPLFGEPIYAYSFLLIGGALALGISGPTIAMAASEPLMAPAPDTGRSIVSTLTEPLRDRNFSHMVRFLFAWSFASNLALPFFAVYMLTKLGYPLPVVIGFTVLSQFSNILFMRVWGPFADRVGSKPVLSMSASLYLLAIIAWPFTTLPEPHRLTLPLITAIHVFAGIAAGGVMLTVGTLALKVAPEGRETPFLSVASIATNLGIGIGPIAGGLLADFFATHSFEIEMRWKTLVNVFELPVISLTGYDFLFVIAFGLGLLSLNLLTALREEGEVPRNIALAELTAGAAPLSRMISSVPGLGSISAFSVGYLKRVPGADVALGVTAYQLAASTRAAAISASRGRDLANEVSRIVSRETEERIIDIQDVADIGSALARHAARGAVEAGEEFAGEVGELTQGAVLGSVRTLVSHSANSLAVLRGAGHGVIQGAAHTGQDLAEVIDSAVQAARDISEELGLTEREAASALIEGALEAAGVESLETTAVIEEALPADLAPPQSVSTGGEERDQPL